MDWGFGRFLGRERRRLGKGFYCKEGHVPSTAAFFCFFFSILYYKLCAVFNGLGFFFSSEQKVEPTTVPSYYLFVFCFFGRENAIENQISFLTFHMFCQIFLLLYGTNYNHSFIKTFSNLGKNFEISRCFYA